MASVGGIRFHSKKSCLKKKVTVAQDPKLRMFEKISKIAQKVLVVMLWYKCRHKAEYLDQACMGPVAYHPFGNDISKLADDHIVHNNVTCKRMWHIYSNILGFLDPGDSCSHKFVALLFNRDQIPCSYFAWKDIRPRIRVLEVYTRVVLPSIEIVRGRQGEVVPSVGMNSIKISQNVGLAGSKEKYLQKPFYFFNQ